MQFIPSFEPSVFLVVFLAFGITALVHLCYVLVIQGKFAFYKKKKPSVSKDSLPPISLIIAARNEWDNLYENLPFILTQEYPQFEVIVINNQSSDDSSQLLRAFQNEYPNLHVIEVEKNPHLRPGKKLSITIGIKGAKYDHFILTDADCRPASRLWLQSMANSFTEEKELIIGYGPYTKSKGFLNRLIRFDTASIGISYYAMALAGMPYMGVGRNIGYTRRLFESVNGFRSHYGLASGDDDLFVQEAGNKKNVSINIDREAFCYSDPCGDWDSWIRQKTRHYTTTDRYEVIKKGMLGIYPLTMLILLISFVILMLSNDFRWLSASVFIFVTGVKWWIQGRCFNKLNEGSLVKYLPLWDIMYTILMPIIYYSSEKKAANKW
jgi:cellulose synthase/poly-beta-1,6-N-acetylglucosamine synthase-like glycosyltransferase